MRAWERGEETDSDDNDDNDDEVVVDSEWDDLESEDTLIGTHSSTQGPFPFHAGGSESVRPAEMGQTIGPSSRPVGAGGSTAAPEVPPEGSGPTTALQEVVEACRSAAAPEVPVEGAAPLPRPTS